MIYWILAGWLICGVLTYFSIRKRTRKEWVWTRADRRIALFLALLGPVGLFAVLFAMGLIDDDRPARW